MRAQCLVPFLTVFFGCSDDGGITADSAGTGDGAVHDQAAVDGATSDTPRLEAGASDLPVGDAGFIGNRSEDLCAGVLTVCKGMTAGCILDDKHYIKGTFPGERKFLVSAASGKKIRVLILLQNKLSPGTETEVSWFEPGCTDEYKYSLSKSGGGQDLFQAAGADDIFEVEHPVVDNGDHLVSVWSDAVAEYLLRVEVL